jgi:hypothetical protein
MKLEVYKVQSAPCLPNKEALYWRGPSALIRTRAEQRLRRCERRPQ